MNIYIYGNKNFKKDIHQTLEQANIKYKLDNKSVIANIDDLEKLKDTIKNNPKDIYLIDDEKIIKKNALSQKIKFLAPKDGIEEEFLLDNGIGDLSVDSLSDIPKYILLKYEQEKAQSEDIQSSIIDIVDDAYNEDIELDDELSLLLASEEIQKDSENLSSSDTKEETFPFENKLEFDSIEKEEPNDLNLDKIDKLINFDEDVGLNNTSFDYDDKNIIQEHSVQEDKQSNENEILVEKFSKEGENMSDDFSELNSLNEQEILSALNGIELDKDISSKNQGDIQLTSSSNKENENVELNSANISDVSELISKLLNNKTLEITVKIKD